MMYHETGWQDEEPGDKNYQAASLSRREISERQLLKTQNRTVFSRHSSFGEGNKNRVSHVVDFL